MLTIILLAYVACIVVAFKVIRIAVKPATVAVAVLGGVFVVGGIAVLWKQGAPMSDQMFVRRHVVRIAPNVREFVSKVHVESNQRVKKGEPLFEISRERFQYAVDQASASLAAARSAVSQLGAIPEIGDYRVVLDPGDTTWGHVLWHILMSIAVFLSVWVVWRF